MEISDLHFILIIFFYFQWKKTYFQQTDIKIFFFHIFLFNLIKIHLDIDILSQYLKKDVYIMLMKNLGYLITMNFVGCLWFNVLTKRYSFIYFFSIVFIMNFYFMINLNTNFYVFFLIQIKILLIIYIVCFFIFHWKQIIFFNFQCREIFNNQLKIGKLLFMIVRSFYLSINYSIMCMLFYISYNQKNSFNKVEFKLWIFYFFKLNCILSVFFDIDLRLKIFEMEKKFLIESFYVMFLFCETLLYMFV